MGVLPVVIFGEKYGDIIFKTDISYYKIILVCVHRAWVFDYEASVMNAVHHDLDANADLQAQIDRFDQGSIFDDSVTTENSKTLCDYIGQPDRWPEKFQPDVRQMIASSQVISRKEFVVWVNPHDVSDLEYELGYNGDKQMFLDYTVAYRKSVLKGRSVYYLTHSEDVYLFA